VIDDLGRAVAGEEEINHTLGGRDLPCSVNPHLALYESRAKRWGREPGDRRCGDLDRALVVAARRLAREQVVLEQGVHGLAQLGAFARGGVLAE